MTNNTPSSNLEELMSLIATPEPPGLGPGPRAVVSPLPRLSQELDSWCRRSGKPQAVQHLIRAAVLLWHDHLDGSHRISQDLPGPDGSYLHGIMHRREPDYGNAKYWFHRVGQHSCFEDLAERASTLLQENNEASLLKELTPRGTWDPFAFIDACESTPRSPGSDARVGVLCSIQALEIELLLARFFQAE